MKLYSALYNDFEPFSVFYPEATCEVAQIPSDLKDPNGWLIVWGGGDIHPSIYNRPNLGSYVSSRPTSRDLSEMFLMKRAIDIGLPILGVCRGAQMGCALAGGILIQDVQNHGTSHMIQILKTEQHILTSSLHHQMMFPWNVEHELIAVSSKRMTREIMGLSDEEVAFWKQSRYLEPEIVWFPKIQCLAIQGHPEFLHSKDEFNVVIHNLMEEFGK